MMRITTQLFIIVSLFLTTQSEAYARTATNSDTVDLFTYFEQMGDEIPTVKIYTDVGRLWKKKLKEEEQEAKVVFICPEGNEVEFTTTIRARGNIRKQVCHNPPLKINFKKKQLLKSKFSNLDELKLVLQCRGSKANVEYLYKERFIYDLYKVIDPRFGILAQLVNFEFYKDGKLDKEVQGFFVEDEDHLTKRLDAKVLESGNIRSSSIQRDHYLKMVFFQYMIANTDWTVPNKHNVEIIKVKDYPRVLAIPYDFDYSGFVGTQYAVPAPSLPIDNVQQRRSMGFQVSVAEAIATAEYFKTKKDDFLKVCEQSTYLDEGMKKDVVKYIESFYKVLQSEKRIKRELATVGR